MEQQDNSKWQTVNTSNTENTRQLEIKPDKDTIKAIKADKDKQVKANQLIKK